MAMTCPLCDKLARLHELADDVVWQFPCSVAFLGPWQYYTGYCVLVSRSHCTELHRLPKDARAAFMEEMVTLSHAIDLAFRPLKLNCKSLGNQVAHLHWHLSPRRQDDRDMLKPVWLALDRAERDDGEKRRLHSTSLPRPEIVARLHDALKQLHAPNA